MKHPYLLPILDGQVMCPRRIWATMARDACVKEQKKRGLCCGIECERGMAALKEHAIFVEDEAREEALRAESRRRNAIYYQRRQTKYPPRRPRAPRPAGVFG